MKKLLLYVITLSIGVVSWAQDVTTDQLLHYPFAGNAVNSVTPGTNDGTVVGATLIDGYDGSTSSAYSFDGINDQIFFGDIDLTTESFTVSFWVKLPEVSTGISYRILSQRATCSVTNFFDIAFSNSTSSGYAIGMEMYGGASNITGHVNTGTLDNPQGWNHISFVKDNDTKTSKVYVNGLLKSTTNWTIPVGSDFPLNSDAQLGVSISPCINGSSTRNFIGSLDELRFHKRALMQADITSLVPFNLGDSYPKASATKASVTSGIRLLFTRSVDESTINSTNITVSGSLSGSLNPTISSLGDGQVMLNFDGGMPAGEEITVSLSGIASTDAATIVAQNFSFTTATDEESKVAYYPFDGDLQDKTDGAINLVVQGTGQSYATNIYNERTKALSLAGNTYVYTGTTGHPELGFGKYEDFTIAFWVKTNTSSALTMPIIETSNNSKIQVYLDAAGKIVFTMTDNNTTESLTTENSYNDLLWHHVVITADRDQGYALYVDGIERASSDVSFPFDFKSGSPVYYGYQLGTSNFMRGYMDEMTYYNKALTSQEVEELVPLEITVSPKDGDTAIEPGTRFTMEFTQNVDVDNFSSATFTLTGGASGSKDITVNGYLRKIEIIPASPFVLNETVTLSYSNLPMENGDLLSATYNFETGDVEKGMLFHYPFDGDANNAVADTLNGTVTAATLTEGFDGTANSAYSFDGTAKISVAPLGLDQQSWTMAFWMKRNGTKVRGEIAGQREQCTGAQWVEISSPYNPYNDKYEVTLTVGETLGGYNAYGVRAEIEPFEWNHIVVQRDAQANKIRIYKNGDLAQETDFLGYYSTFNNKTFELGNGNACVGVDGRQAYNGDMDEVRFYMRALTPEEIVKLTDFKIEESFPESGATAVSATSNIILDLNRSIDESTITSNSVSISAAGGAALDYSVQVQGDSLIITPDSTWPVGKLLSVNVNNIKSTDGESLSSGIVFTVASEEDGLLLHLPLDGTSKDAGMYGYSLTTSPLNYLSDRFKNLKSSMQFVTGTQRFLQIPSTEAVERFSFGRYEDFSISTWFKAGSSSGNQILYKRSATPGTYVVKTVALLDNSGHFSLTIDDGLGSAQTLTTSGINYTDGYWHHVTFSVDRDGEIQIIIDGDVVASAESQFINANVTGNIYIGGNGTDNDSEYWRGQLDDFRIYNRSLSVDDVAAFAPKYIAISPQDGYDAVSLNESFEIEFLKKITAATAIADNFTLTGSTSGAIAVSVTGGDTRNLIIDPATNFAIDEEITLSFTGLMYEDGNAVPDKTFTFESANVNKGMLVYYPFNGDASNQASKDYNGTITGATLIDDRNAGTNSAYSFGGSDFITIGEVPLARQSFTYSFWMKRDAAEAQQSLVGYRATCNTSNQLNINTSWSSTLNSYTIAMSIANTSFGQGFLNYSVYTPIEVDTWTHVSIVRNNEAEQLQIYINGNLEAVSSFNANIDISNAAIMGIGTGSACIGVDGTQRFTGDLDEFRIYNRAITAEEAAALPDMAPDVPQISTTLADVTVDEDAAESMLYDLSTAFSSTGDLDYSASSSDENVSVRIEGTSLHMVPAADFSGSATITVEAFNGIKATQTFTVTVNPINDAPAFELSNSSITLTKNFTETLNIYVQDLSPADESDQTIAYAIEPASVAFANISFDAQTGHVSITSVTDEVGSQTFTITADDAQGANNTSTATFDLTVVDNLPPTLDASIDDLTMDEDGTAVASADLTAVFGDPNDDVLTFTASSDNDGVIPTVSSGALNIDLEADFNGSAVITVTASDGVASVDDTFTVTVNPVNDAPIVESAVADQVTDEDSNFTFQLPTDQFSDVDGDEVTISEVTFTGQNGIAGSWLTYNEVSGTISGLPGQDQVGVTEVSVTATDGTESVTDIFTVTVNNVNDAPSYTSYVNVSIDEDGTAATRDLSTIFVDEDGDALTYSFSIVETNVIVDVTLNGAILTITPLSNLYGTQTIRVTGDDGALSTSFDLGVTINSVNDVPVINSPVADQIASEDELFSVNIPADQFTDADGQDLTLQSITFTGQNSTDGSWLGYDETTRVLSGTPGQANVGITLVTMIVTDGVATATDEFLVTVNNVNDVPVVANSVSMTFQEDDAANTLDLNSIFTDEDNETLTYSFPSGPARTTENGTIISSSISSNILTVTPLANANGQTTLTIVASDAVSSVSYALPITVNAVNDAPVFNTTFSNTFIYEYESYSLTADASWYSDVDGDDLTVTISANQSWLTYDAESLTLSGTASSESIGFTTITIQVSDGTETITTSYTIEVVNVNEAPTDIALDNSTIQENFDDIQMVGIITGTDPDAGDVLSFSLLFDEGSTNDNSEFSISIKNDQYELYFNGTADFEVKASYTVAISVTDQGELGFTKNFTITVEDSEEPLGFEDIQLSAYPNPTTDVLYIESKEQIDRYQIINLDGKILNQGFDKAIDVKSLNNGAYLLRVQAGKQTEVIRFIKE